MKLTLDCVALLALALLFVVPRLAEAPAERPGTATVTIGAPRPAAVQTLADVPAQSDAAKIDAEKSDAAKSDAAKSGAANTDAARPDAAKSDAAKYDAGKPGASDAASSSTPGAPSASSAPSAPPRNCVDADGKTFTWAYPNVPAGTVRCDPDETQPR